MSKFSHFAVKKLYFKQSFNNINGNRGPLFSQINFDQKYFGRSLARAFLSGALCPGTDNLIKNVEDGDENVEKKVKMVSQLEIMPD